MKTSIREYLLRRIYYLLSAYYVATTLLLSWNPFYSYYPLLQMRELSPDRLSAQDYQHVNSCSWTPVFLITIYMASSAWQSYRVTRPCHLVSMSFGNQKKRPITDNSQGEGTPEDWVQDGEGRIIRSGKGEVGTNNRHCISAQLLSHSNT